MRLNLISKAGFTYALLFLLSFGIYFFYYHHLILNLNTVLFKTEGDSLKNYYTYLYHIKNDLEPLNFTGLNFPFGEHIVYTDCQPLLSVILKALPLTHGHLIGILHGLILMSFIITPLILFKIFLKLDVNKSIAFFSSLAIAVLSPQIQRLGGHFALAYGCIIPIGILLLLSYFEKSSFKNITPLVVYNFLLFFVHPYFGLGLSLFCFISILTRTLLQFNRKIFKNLLSMFLTGVVPILMFKLFMLVTDTHKNRPDEPYGVDIMGAAASPESVFTPSFGPFMHFLKSIVKSKQVEWEALSYIGIFPLFVMIISVIIFPFFLKRFRVRRELAALFITGLFFLFFSFGSHILLLDFFKLKIASLNQFRAFGRFAWYFYFLLPIFLITIFSNVVKSYSFKSEKIVLTGFGMVFFFFNMLEAHYLLKNMMEGNFNDRNIFNLQQITASERTLIDRIKASKFQAIIPLPVFHIGSEIYQRNGDESVRPAMFYSYHTRLPILSVMLSRTSLNETETALEILNIYKAERKIDSLITNKSFLIMKTSDNLREDELRLLNTLEVYDRNAKNYFFTAKKKDFKLSKSDLKTFTDLEHVDSNQRKNIMFIQSKKRKPFIQSKIVNFETIAEIDSNTIESGEYTISFHYHLKKKKFKYIHNNFIVIKENKQSSIWETFISVRNTSGFYGNFIVFEQHIRIDNHFVYKFVLNGSMDEPYRISHFLLKPQKLNLKIVRNGTPLFNNYPN